MDGGSTDKTKQIAEAGGALFCLRPVSQKVNVETQENLDFIKKNIKTDWIYWGYADNIAPQELLEKLTEISKQNVIKRVMIPLYTYLWGNTKNYALKSYAPFLFHKDYIDFTNNYIHGIGNFLGIKNQTLFLPNKNEYALKHFSTYNLSKFVTNHLRYAESEAFEKNQKGQKFSCFNLLKALLGYLWIFGKYNLKNGKLGLLIVLNYLSYRVMSYTRLYEYENNITLESIEHNYSLKKEDMLNKFK
jgi:hypothetical protein